MHLESRTSCPAQKLSVALSELPAKAWWDSSLHLCASAHERHAHLSKRRKQKNDLSSVITGSFITIRVVVSLLKGESSA